LKGGRKRDEAYQLWLFPVNFCVSLTPRNEKCSSQALGWFSSLEEREEGKMRKERRREIVIPSGVRSCSEFTELAAIV